MGSNPREFGTLVVVTMGCGPVVWITADSPTDCLRRSIGFSHGPHFKCRFHTGYGDEGFDCQFAPKGKL